MGHSCTCASAQPFLYPENGWTDCAELLNVVRDPLARRFTEVGGGVHVYMRTRVPPFRVSGTARQIAFKFGVWFGEHQALHNYAFYTMGISVRVHVWLYTYLNASILSRSLIS